MFWLGALVGIIATALTIGVAFLATVDFEQIMYLETVDGRKKK